jgi:hypothetical protein
VASRTRNRPGSPAAWNRGAGAAKESAGGDHLVLVEHPVDDVWALIGEPSTGVPPQGFEP